MKFRYRSQFNVLFRTGLIFLIFANVVRSLLHPSRKLPEPLADGLIGFFYGIAIALMLWGVARNRRQCKVLTN